MSKKYDILIIGGGIFGAAIFYYLTKISKKKVALLESKKFCVGATGSSGGFIRMLHSSPRLSELAVDSYHEFAECEKKFGTSCGFIQTGFFTITDDVSSSCLLSNVELLRQLGVDIARFTGAEAKKLFPSLPETIRDDKVILYESASGYANPAQMCQIYLDAGSQLGGIAIENIEVTDIVLQNNRVRGVNTTHSFFEAECIVVAAGGASGRLLNNLGIIIEICSKRVQVNYYAYPDGANIHIPTFFNTTLGLYGRHDQKLNRFLLGLADSPSELQNSAADLLTPAVDGKLEEVTSQFFPWFNANLWRGGKCASDAYTTSGECISGSISAIQGLFVAAGGSGVGFKTAPAVGKRIAAEILGQL